MVIITPVLDSEYYPPPPVLVLEEEEEFVEESELAESIASYEVPETFSGVEDPLLELSPTINFERFRPWENDFAFRVWKGDFSPSLASEGYRAPGTELPAGIEELYPDSPEEPEDLLD